MMSFPTTTTGPAEGTPITAVPPEIIETHILTRLDGPTLASAGCAFSQLRTLCSEENLWRRICDSSWPSTTNPIVRDAISALPSGHRSLFSDSFPTIHHRVPRPESGQGTTELISAVDIFYGGGLIYSKVTVSETVSSWFLSSPFRVDLLNMKGTVVRMPVKFDGDDGKCVAHLEEHLKLSWILIDPSSKRAVNVSSLKPVNFRRHWLTGEMKIRFATVVDGGGDGGDPVQCSVVVICEGKEGGELYVRDASMQVEDVEGKVLNGKDSMVILGEAMESLRKKREEGEEKERYKTFVVCKKQWREMKRRKEKRMDLACIAGGICTLIVFFSVVFLGSEKGYAYCLRFFE
ncbi:unnamed protein product [Cuscuta epithymum]|uniref:F-box domain-containing protein n=1 Tax=Cuscuta epithymum TaxID=186058 RepID=A0AAV0GJL4_9ASTE|nr:unnamed protein product [Cuscuta epithymum]